MQVATQHRWTNVGAAQRRFILLLAMNRIVVSSLKGVKTHWGLTEDLIASLAREVEADSNAFPAKNKLRLLRIVEGFCHEMAVEFMTISTVATEVIDRVLFAVLGGPGRPRVSLAALVHPINSPLVACQQDLWLLLHNFCEAEQLELPGPSWWLLGRLGCSYDDTVTRLAARKALLQLSAALTSIFEIRMEKAPYRLSWLIYEDDIVGGGCQERGCPHILGRARGVFAFVLSAVETGLPFASGIQDDGSKCPSVLVPRDIRISGLLGEGPLAVQARHPLTDIRSRLLRNEQSAVVAAVHCCPCGSWGTGPSQEGRPCHFGGGRSAGRGLACPKERRFCFHPFQQPSAKGTQGCGRP
jgi:hypothetical protein